MILIMQLLLVLLLFFLFYLFPYYSQLFSPQLFILLIMVTNYFLFRNFFLFAKMGKQNDFFPNLIQVCGSFDQVDP